MTIKAPIHAIETKVFLSLCFLLTWSSIGIGQPDDSPSRDIPYRRVFVPSKDLDSIGVDEFRPIEVNRLEELLQKYSRFTSEATSDDLTETAGRIQLQSMYYVAKLVGADLFSERSQVTLVGTPRPGERFTLRPWSLAVQLPLAMSTKFETQTPPIWIFDAKGLPQIAMNSAESTETEDGTKQPQFSFPFGWSTRADSSSTPNHLKFSFEIPRCANSCLVLALPPQAVVEDSPTVVRRVGEWAEIDRRLSDWNDFARERVREQSMSRSSTESLWLIELGGSSIASFSIALGVGNRSQDDSFSSDSKRYMQLIASQNNEHFVEGHEIRTTCEAEVLVSQEQSGMRMSLDEGARLRRLMVNQQEVEWEFDNGWIQWSMGSMFQGALPAKSAIVFAEFLSPLEAEKLGQLSMPKIAFERGYVMTGTTVVHSESTWRITNAESESSRITEPNGDSKPEVTRIEYSWNASPPHLTIGVERVTPSKRCEILTRLANKREGALAVIRAKLYFAEQDTSQIQILISPGWSILGVNAMDPNDPVSIQTDAESNERLRTVNMSWGHIQKNRVADIELRLFRSAIDSPDKPRRLEHKPIFQMHDWKKSDILVVEDDGMFELRLRDSLVDLLISDELIPDWQRSLLPKMGPYYVFRFESHSLDDSGRNNDGSYLEQHPGLVAFQDMEWEEKPSRFDATLKTDVDRTLLQSLCFKHEIKLGFHSNRSEPVSIHLPSDNVVWRLKQGNKWIPLSPLEKSPALSNPTTGVWLFDLSQTEGECTLLAIANTEIKDEKEFEFRIPVLLNADVRSQEARCSATDVNIHCDDRSCFWDIDDAGHKFLNLNTLEPGRALFASVLEQSPVRKWIVNERELHVAIDELGTQRAALLIRSSDSPSGTIAIELDDGWNPSTVLARSSSSSWEVPFKMDGRRLVISRDQNDTGDMEWQIEMVGSRLQRNFSLVTMDENYVFNWPEFLVDSICLSHRQHLWLPATLQLVERDNASRGTEQELWPMWRWSRQVAATFFTLSTRDERRPTLVSFASSGGLIPSWDLDGWRVVSTDSHSPPALSSEKNSNSKLHAIGRVDAGRSCFAILFALVALSTPRLILFRYHAALLLAFILVVWVHFAPAEVSRLAYTGVIGMSAGFLLFAIYWLLSIRANNERNDSHRNSARLSPWHDRGGESGSIDPQGQQSKDSRTSIANLGSLGLFLTLGLIVPSAYSIFPSFVFGQDKPDGRQKSVYQIVIPMDDAGNMVGTTAFVPKEMLDVLNGESERIRLADRGTHPLSARHNLRVGTRGRAFNTSDQITMIYDFLVGEDLEPFRFPINASQLLFPRFSVDGIELSLGDKLRSNGSQWIWTPDKSGKHTVQIIAQPELKSNESDRNRDSLTQQLDIALLPVANASIDIETDPQNRIEIVSRGRVADPAAGRFVAMLGALDRLQCSFITPLSKPSGTFSSPLATTPDAGEAPVMHTELFLQNDLVQAKTIVDFPKGVPSSPVIEIEADLQWLPVGTQWGDARWVETRPGTTLSRRRYLLEWKGTPSNSTPSSPTARDRQISVVWVPQSATQSLNVLFAECRDRRTRRGMLRYSRVPGANWSIEGINTWIPAIGSKDRLEWPELKNNPIATTLRIPLNGGFGRLNHKILADRQQARVTTKWIVQPNRETLTSHIELPGRSTSDTLIVDLPSDFLVTDLRNRNGPIRYLQSKSNGKLHLQVLAERRTLEDSDLWIQATRQGTHLADTVVKENWLEFPWVALPTSVDSDQTMEIIASEHVAFRLESEPRPVFGKGLKVPILKLARPYSDLLLNTSAVSRYQLIQRKDPLIGKLTVKRNSDSLQRELEVVGELSTTTFSRPYYILEVPASLKDRWQSELRIKVVPFPDSNKAWLQIPIPEPSTLDAKNEVSNIIRFIPRSDESLSDLQLISRIHALDRNLIPTHPIDSRVQDAKDEHTTKESFITTCILRIRDSNFWETPTTRCVLLESQYWIEETEGSHTANQELEWHVGDDVDVISIQINGKQSVFRKYGPRIICPLTQTGLCSDVHVFSKHKTPTNSNVPIRIDAPELKSNSLSEDMLVIDTPQIDVFSFGRPLATTMEPDAIQAITESCLVKMERSTALWPNSDRIDLGSELDQWKKHWATNAYQYLHEWSKTTNAGQQEAFGRAVARWHSLQTHVRTKFCITAHQERESTKATAEGSLKNKWYSLSGCLLILLTIYCLAPTFGTVLFQRPWWSLLSMGLFAWLVCGSVLPALFLGSIGLVVAVDSYWLLTSQLRRIGTRGQRSL